MPDVLLFFLICTVESIGKSLRLSWKVSRWFLKFMFNLVAVPSLFIIIAAWELIKWVCRGLWKLINLKTI